MGISISRELITFASMIVLGLAEGVIFDLFRILRRFIPKKIWAVNIADICFWITAAVVFLGAVFYISDGELRGYIFIGLILGLVFYFLCLSTFLINAVLAVIRVIFKIFKLIFKILLTPTFFLYKILLRPIINGSKSILKRLWKRAVILLKKLSLRIRGKRYDKKTKQKQINLSFSWRCVCAKLFCYGHKGHNASARDNRKCSKD